MMPWRRETGDTCSSLAPSCTCGATSESSRTCFTGSLSRVQYAVLLSRRVFVPGHATRRSEGALDKLARLRYAGSGPVYQRTVLAPASSCLCVRLLMGAFVCAISDLLCNECGIRRQIGSARPPVRLNHLNYRAALVPDCVAITLPTPPRIRSTVRAAPLHAAFMRTSATGGYPLHRVIRRVGASRHPGWCLIREVGSVRHEECTLIA